jgi:hypothetical protein
MPGTGKFDQAAAAWDADERRVPPGAGKAGRACPVFLSTARARR